MYHVLMVMCLFLYCRFYGSKPPKHMRDKVCCVTQLFKATLRVTVTFSEIKTNKTCLQRVVLF